MKTLAFSKQILVCIAFLMMLSCGQQPGSNEGGLNQQQDQNVNNQASDSNAGNTILIKMEDQEIAKVMASASNIRFILKGTEYQSKLSGDKRKYAVKQGEIAFEVKYKDDAFKVRTPEGNLLWKIKLYDDKVKISNNEENLNGYEIKTSSPEKFKLKKDEVTLGEIELKKPENRIVISSSSKSFIAESDRIFLAYGVLLIDEIPENIQYIIMSELIAKGK